MSPLPWVKVKKVRQSFSIGAAVFAEAVAGGQIEHPDADDREEDETGDPDVGCDVVVVDAGEEEAADQRDQEGKDSAERFGC